VSQRKLAVDDHVVENGWQIIQPIL